MDLAESNSRLPLAVSSTLRRSRRDRIASRNSRICKNASERTRKRTERVSRQFATASDY